MSSTTKKKSSTTKSPKPAAVETPTPKPRHYDPNELTALVAGDQDAVAALIEAMGDGLDRNTFVTLALVQVADEIDGISEAVDLDAADAQRATFRIARRIRAIRAVHDTIRNAERPFEVAP